MIHVEGLTRYYGHHRAIENISFNIGSNEIVGFLGLNGAGKSTILRILAGLLLPTRGEVRIHDEDLVSASIEMRREIGFLPETPPLHREMTTRSYLAYVARLRGVPQEQVGAAIEDAARRTRIERVLDRVIGALSWGYQKRVGIAQAIIHAPRLVILDEPIAGLDPVQIVDMRGVIRGLRETCTVLVSSHILSEIHQTCDRILVIHQGRIVAEGTEKELAGRVVHATGVHMVLRAEAEALETFLEDHEAVDSWDLQDRKGELIFLTIELTGDYREVLVRDLVEAGFGIRRVTDTEAELEHIFVELTREGAA